MKKQPCRVHVIVDGAFGERLCEIPAGEFVWIVDTEVNRLACAAVRKERNSENHTVDITSFKIDSKVSPGDWLISEIEMIDLHHPLWSIINVIGTAWTRLIQTELARFGFDEHEDTAEGFMARKRNTSHPRHPCGTH